MNPVLDALTDDGHGRLSHRGGRVLLIRPETLAALQREVETALGAGAHAAFVAGGRAGGGRATGSLDGDRAGRVASLLRLGTALGWGEFALEALEPNRLVVTVRASALAEAYGESSGAVCHLIRGVLDSLASSVLDTPAPVVETHCAAAGAPVCRFEAVTSVRA